MRQLSFLLFVLLFLSQTAQAAELETKGTCRRKFQRGILNVAFSPLEISQALAEEKEKRQHQAFFPSFVGLGRGSWFAALRAFSGVYDIVTAPFPIPPRYEPIMHPEFSLEYLDLLKDEA